MSKEISADAIIRDNMKNCPVTGLSLLSLQEFTEIHMKGDYYISLLKIGDSIVYISGKGNLKNFDVEQFNKVVDDFCNKAQVSKPYVQIRDVTNLSGSISLSKMQQQGRYFFNEQDTYLGVITINDQPWMKLFIRYGVRFFSPKTRFISAKNYTDALQQAQQLLTGNKTINYSLYSGAKNNTPDNSITISKSYLDEILNACSHLLLDEKVDDLSVLVSTDNPLFEIAEILELVKADLNEQRKTDLEINQERLKESEKNRRQLLSIMEDNEAAKESLLKTKAEMTALVENTIDSIWSVNKNYEIIYVNEVFVKAYEATMGVTLRPGTKILDTVNPEERSVWKDRYDKVLNGERWVIIDKYDTHGSSMYAEIAAHPIYNNDRVVGASLFGRDITERIHAEETRQQLEVVNNTIKIKQNFLANMSHEIRTPLTGILGMAELLEQTNLSEEQKDFVTTMKVSGDNLKEIINQVLDFSKIEAGKVKLKPSVFEFSSLILETEKLHKNIVRNSVELRTNIDPNIPLHIFADKPRIAQVLNNLTSNAIKFTACGSVTINTLLMSSANKSKEIIIKIEVQDTGKGIPPEKQKNLFVPFSQVEDNDRRNYEGTGLGLTISKELIQLMGGEIGFGSQPEKGSLFWFTFPATIAQNIQQTVASSGETIQNHSLNILLAEDKLVNQKVINLMLTALGHKVTIAANGEQAIEIFDPAKFDLILMDIQMPVMDGVTATQKLKEKYNDLPPIVGLSANAFEGDREKYMALGMDEYLTKPVKKGDFVGLIRKLIV